MATKVELRTEVLSTVKVGGTGKDAVKTAADIIKLIGRPLGSPINGKSVGEKFDVTLTGQIQISKYGERKSAHFLTKEGYKIAVNAGFDPKTHVEGAEFKAICLENEVEDSKGVKRMIKYCAFTEKD